MEELFPLRLSSYFCEDFPTLPPSPFFIWPTDFLNYTFAYPRSYSSLRQAKPNAYENYKSPTYYKHNSYAQDLYCCSPCHLFPGLPHQERAGLFCSLFPQQLAYSWCSVNVCGSHSGCTMLGTAHTRPLLFPSSRAHHSSFFAIGWTYSQSFWRH